MINGILDGVRHDDARLVDQCVMHGLIKHLLELHGVFSDSDMTRRREIGFVDHLTFSADHAE